MEKQNLAPQENKRKITVYNMVGDCQVEFKTDAQNWGQLKKELKNKGIKYTDMKAVIGETQEELHEEDQALVRTEISLFLTPMKVSSGN